MVHFQSVGQIMHPRSTLVRVRDDHHLVSSIDQLGGELIDVTLDSSGLWEKEVADHGNVVRHCDAPPTRGLGWISVKANKRMMNRMS